MSYVQRRPPVREEAAPFAQSVALAPLDKKQSFPSLPQIGYSARTSVAITPISAVLGFWARSLCERRKGKFRSLAGFGVERELTISGLPRNRPLS
jgi:hypothetical protein